MGPHGGDLHGAGRGAGWGGARVLLTNVYFRMLGFLSCSGITLMKMKNQLGFRKSTLNSDVKIWCETTLTDLL